MKIISEPPKNQTVLEKYIPQCPLFLKITSGLVSYWDLCMYGNIGVYLWKLWIVTRKAASKIG